MFRDRDAVMVDECSRRYAEVQWNLTAISLDRGALHRRLQLFGGKMR